MRYNGGKGVCFPLLINLMPQHTRYIETHLGGGAVMRNKRPAQQQIGIDIDPAVAELWNRQWPGLCDVINSDAVDYLERNALDGDTLIYADPPYLPETRRRSRVYRHDYSANDHERLLECLTAVPCRVMISGYPSALYERYLGGWSTHRFRARTHVETKEEWVWFNYSKPSVLHDDRYFGENFREREVIRRRQDRLRHRIDRLSVTEKVSLYSWLSNKVAEERLI